MAELNWPKSFVIASDLPDDEVTVLIEALIAVLDLRAGDIDLETTGAEDDFMAHGWDGPGCPVSDPDFSDLERGELTTIESIDQSCAAASFDHEDDEDDAPIARRRHRDRVRREQCSPKRPDGYRLNREVRI